MTSNSIINRIIRLIRESICVLKPTLYYSGGAEFGHRWFTEKHGEIVDSIVCDKCGKRIYPVGQIREESF